MKKLTNLILGLAALAGIMLAGSDANNFMVQVLTCTGGLVLFAASMWIISRIN